MSTYVRSSISNQKYANNLWDDSFKHTDIAYLDLLSLIPPVKPFTHDTEQFFIVGLKKLS